MQGENPCGKKTIPMVLDRRGRLEYNRRKKKERGKGGKRGNDWAWLAGRTTRASET
jgi:hypothetical protein